MRTGLLVGCLLLCLLFCGCTDRIDREAPGAVPAAPEPSSPAPATLVDLPTGGTFPTPPVLNDGKPLTLALHSATIRVGGATGGAPGPEGTTLLILNVTVRNVGEASYDFRQSSVRVVDSDNRQARPFSGTIPGERELGDGRLPRDGSRSGTVAFEVSPRADRHFMVLIYDDRTHESLCLTLFQATEEA